MGQAPSQKMTLGARWAPKVDAARWAPPGRCRRAQSVAPVFFSGKKLADRNLALKKLREGWNFCYCELKVRNFSQLTCDAIWRIEFWYTGNYPQFSPQISSDVLPP